MHCALLGWLLWRSERFPAVLGILLAAASAGYLAESFAYFLVPAWEAAATGLVIVTASVAEVSLCLWLIVKGVRPARIADGAS